MRGERLLATDLDRTLLPNGEAEESPGARAAFAALVRQGGIQLAYVTGRSLPLVEQAMAEYDLPRPDWVLADVGSTLYRAEGDGWQEDADWADHLAAAWPDRNGPDLARHFTDLPGLRLQPAAAQRPFKLSFFADLHLDAAALCAEMRQRLESAELPAIIVHSVDEAAEVGLVDVLPRGSSKVGALEFLRRRLGLSRAAVLFAGDSGNDLEVLVSDIPAVLVANASDEVRRRAVAGARARGTTAALHLAAGGKRGMNGNYAAGILEGWDHFVPPDQDSLLWDPPRG